MTETQRTIIDYARTHDRRITKKEAVALLERNYYRNAAKYVGEVLSRMVQRKFLVRLKPGVFEVGRKIPQGPLPGEGKQLDLFERIT